MALPRLEEAKQQALYEVAKKKEVPQDIKATAKEHQKKIEKETIKDESDFNALIENMEKRLDVCEASSSRIAQQLASLLTKLEQFSLGEEQVQGVKKERKTSQSQSPSAIAPKAVHFKPSSSHDSKGNLKSGEPPQQKRKINDDDQMMYKPPRKIRALSRSLRG